MNVFFISIDWNNMHVEKGREQEALKDIFNDRRNARRTLKFTDDDNKRVIKASSNWRGRSALWLAKHVPLVAELFPCIDEKAVREFQIYRDTYQNVLEIVQRDFPDSATSRLDNHDRYILDPVRGLTCGAARTLLFRAVATKKPDNGSERKDGEVTLAELEQSMDELEINAILNRFAPDNSCEDTSNQIDRRDVSNDSGRETPNPYDVRPSDGYDPSKQALSMAMNLHLVKESDRVQTFKEVIEIFIRPEIRSENLEGAAGANETVFVEDFTKAMVFLAGQIGNLPSGCESGTGEQLALIGNDVRFWAFENIITSMLTNPFRTKVSPGQRGAITLTLATQLGHLPSGANHGNAGAGDSAPPTDHASGIRWPRIKGFAALAQLYITTTDPLRKRICDELQRQAAVLPQGSVAAELVQGILQEYKLVSQPE